MKHNLYRHVLGFKRLKKQNQIQVFLHVLYLHTSAYKFTIKNPKERKNKSDMADQASFSSRTSTPFEFWTFFSSGMMDFNITFTSSATLSSALWRRLWKGNENQKKQLKLQYNQIQLTTAQIHSYVKRVSAYSRGFIYFIGGKMTSA